MLENTCTLRINNDEHWRSPDEDTKMTQKNNLDK